MATNCVLNWGLVTTRTGNQLTVTGETFGSTGLATLTIADISAKTMDLLVTGDVQGALRIPIADEDTLEGMISPAEAAVGAIQLTHGGAGAAIGLLAEELHSY